MWHTLLLESKVFFHTILDLAMSVWGAGVDGLFRTADIESDGDSLLCSNYSLLLFFPLCWGKDSAQISVGQNICSASEEVQDECKVKRVCACVMYASAALYAHDSVIVGLFMDSLYIIKDIYYMYSISKNPCIAMASSAVQLLTDWELDHIDSLSLQ